jgi:hypothetical protein
MVQVLHCLGLLISTCFSSCRSSSSSSKFSSSKHRTKILSSFVNIGQLCQMAVVTATFQKCGSFKKLMSVKKCGRESGCEPCSQTPTNDTPAIAGMLATARIPAAGTRALRVTSKRMHNLNSKKRQQQQDLFKKAKEVAVNVAVIKNLVAVKDAQVAVVLLRVAVKACRDLATLNITGFLMPESWLY